MIGNFCFIFLKRTDCLALKHEDILFLQITEQQLQKQECCSNFSSHFLAFSWWSTSAKWTSPHRRAKRFISKVLTSRRSMTSWTGRVAPRERSALFWLVVWMALTSTLTSLPFSGAQGPVRYSEWICSLFGFSAELFHVYSWDWRAVKPFSGPRFRLQWELSSWHTDGQQERRTHLLFWLHSMCWWTD